MAAGMLHADLRERLVLDTGAIPWVASPEPGVWRRMLERAGAESGRATSIVRYEAGARFHAHRHPMGEEFFVLEGIFSDEHGNYPAGSYVLNPPDSGHAPWTRDGCVLFVRLCQYAGPGRKRIVADSARMKWRPSGTPGIAIKEFYSDSSHPERVALIKWKPGARYPRHSHPGGEEFLVLEGALVDEAGRYRHGAWIRNPPGSAHEPSSPEGCVLLIKTGGVRPSG
jgi:anti-sigma factor ChrR (cupin superfamily)